MLERYQEELSINFIFTIDDLNAIYPNSTLEYGVGESLWEKMVQECSDLYPLQPLPDGVDHTLRKFDMAGKTKILNCTKLVKSMDTDSPKESECVQDSLRSLHPVSRRATKWPLRLGSGHLAVVVARGSVLNLKRTFAPRSRTDGKPTSQKEKAENKTKNTVASPICNIPDLVKLANELKDALDQMIKDGLDDSEITVVGV
ncbi:hypothetical protein INT45_007635 [Circinella minor]|uniref:Uncharacterized protein n=1 Tax=Circinella minor TaxID=1195481 RepID=A0A8H7RVS3_9FUNG|nr:hypothetical protein INT45_007635 [Circinella minor]